MYSLNHYLRHKKLYCIGDSLMITMTEKHRVFWDQNRIATIVILQGHNTKQVIQSE